MTSSSQIVRFKINKLRHFLLVGSCLLLATACTPTVQVAVPSEPITINLNIKIEHEIKIKVERELDELFSEDSELF
jgi:hypothetical protein